MRVLWIMGRVWVADLGCSLCAEVTTAACGTLGVRDVLSVLRRDDPASTTSMVQIVCTTNSL